MNLLTQEITDKEFVQDLIPQKKPFVMVDKLLFFSTEKVTAGLTVTKENLFTHNNTFAASGLIEHMAQTVALYTGYQYFLKNEPAPVGYIGAIKTIEIHRLPFFSEELVTTATILHEIMGVTLVDIQTESKGEILATSQMKTVIAN
jgi:3-hydroxyacyl-[acyl-carrier-protein] dehydratase